MPKLKGEQLDDLVAVWHDSECENKQPLNKWLELSEADFIAWASTEEPPEMTDKAYEKAHAKWFKYCSIEGATK